jgi:hypothetical protein
VACGALGEAKRTARHRKIEIYCKQARQFPVKGSTIKVGYCSLSDTVAPSACLMHTLNTILAKPSIKYALRYLLAYTLFIGLSVLALFILMRLRVNIIQLGAYWDWGHRTIRAVDMWFARAGYAGQRHQVEKAAGMFRQGRQPLGSRGGRGQVDQRDSPARGRQLPSRQPLPPAGRAQSSHLRPASATAPT